MQTRLFFSIGFGFCIIALGIAYFLQYGLGLEPCPLCIVERLCIFLTLVIFGIAILHNPQKRGQQIYAGLSTLSVLLGLGFAARHLYLQALPKDQVPDCGPGFDYLIKNFPLSEVLPLLLKGSGQCAQSGPLFLSLTLSQWTAIAFVGLLFWSLAPLLGLIKMGTSKTP